MKNSTKDWIVNTKNTILIFLCFFALPACTITQINGINYLGVDNVFVQQSLLSKKQIKVVENGEPNLELGIAFKVQCNGYIKSVNVITPAKGNITITVWDYDTHHIIQTLNANAGDADMNKVYVETKIPTQNGKTYAITYNTRAYYFVPLNSYYESLNNQKILFLKSVYAEGRYTRFPAFTAENILHGLVDIGFYAEIPKIIN